MAASENDPGNGYKKGRSEVFAQPVLDPGKKSAGTPGAAGFLGPGLNGLGMAGDGPFDRGRPGFWDVAEHRLRFVTGRLETPCEPDLVRLFVLAYPVGRVHVPSILCLLDGVSVILREVDLALEGCQLLIDLSGNLDLLPAHNFSYTVMQGYGI